MPSPQPHVLDPLLETLPLRYPGPGGALAVLKDGSLLAARCWGFADAEKRVPFTRETLFLICSITKQFTCALLLDQFPDPTVLQPDLQATVAHCPAPLPGILDLCHNQSGFRDYWALAMLCGADVESPFGPKDARRLIGATRSLQFSPGTRYSYANQNFRVLADLIAARRGEPFERLLRERIFDPVGMPHARLNPDTSSVPGGTIGYEGSQATGFRPAVNRIHWTGDAGIAASLEDLIAWERHIDATRDAADGLYRRLSAPTRYRDGAPAFYGFGLGHMSVGRHAATGHGGGLRGWRSFRLYAPAERVSIVVLFNHMADPRAAALEIFSALVDEPAPAVAPAPVRQALTGRFLDSETGLAVRVEAATEGQARLYFGANPEPLGVSGAGELKGAQTRIHRVGSAVRMERVRENLHSALKPCTGAASPDIEGRFHCAELDATLTVTLAGGVPYGAFSGFLGEGSMQALVPFGEDVWLLPCARALDYDAPGDWTLRVLRNPGGSIGHLQVGCWLARGLEFRRLS
jgi:D-aminopeptidase